MVAAAIIGAAVVGAAASSHASHEASSATRDSTNAAIEQQQGALTEQGKLSQPYRDLGTSAIDKYSALLGIGKDGSSGLTPSISDALQGTPGYQFAMEQGDKGILNAASTQGGISGNTIAEMLKFKTGLASATLGQERDALGTAVRTGQAAAAGQAQNVGAAADNIGGLIRGQGQTEAGIQANQAAALTKVFGNAADQWQTNNALKALRGQAGGDVSDGLEPITVDAMYQIPPLPGG